MCRRTRQPVLRRASALAFFSRDVCRCRLVAARGLQGKPVCTWKHLGNHAGEQKKVTGGGREEFRGLALQSLLVFLHPSAPLALRAPPLIERCVIRVRHGRWQRRGPLQALPYALERV